MGSFLCLPLSTYAALFPVDQNSLPAGLVSQNAIIEEGVTYTSINPDLSKNGYTFGYWAIDGTRQAGADGRSLTRVSGVIQADSNFTAHYFADNADTDSDGVKDWFEYRMFGDLSRSPSDDSDGDGFTNKRESELGQDPLVVDEMEAGGIAGRMSNTFSYADTSMQVVTIKSNPSGFITTSISNKELNASVTTQSLNGATNGSHFAYWTINGVRQASPNGVASSKVSLNISGATDIVAYYIPSTEDTDGDGVLDWFEMYQFGNLASGPEDDSDGDGFSNKREAELGQEATIAEFVEAGGIAGRMSNTFSYADTSMVLATITSDPKGFITESITYKESNSTVTTQNLNGATNGSHFAYWTIDGVRQYGPTGVSQSKVSATITADTIFSAHYIPSTEDTDADGVVDWFEMYQFGNLNKGPNDDPDGDGYSNKREGELGQEATIAEFVEGGGIAGRMSNSVVYYLQVNNPPDALNLSSTNVHANKPAGEQVGIFQPSDPDDPNAIGTYQISLVDGSTDNAKFTIAGRILKTNAVLALGNYSIRVRVADDENASFQKTFAIQAINDPNKDDDNDGLTYAQEQALGTSDDNVDSDGDGFSDGAEVLAGTNPADANSKPPNQAPTAIDLNGTSLAENQVAGTIVGEFNATDPDVNATITLTFADGNGSQHNNLFTIDANGTIRTAATFDYETNATALHIRVKATDEHNASLAKAFVINVTNVVEDLDGDGIEDHADTDDDGDGFSDAAEIAYGSDPRDNQSVANQAPSLLDLNGTSIAENSSAGSIVGTLDATDPDANATHVFALVDGNGSAHNANFAIDSNGTLRTVSVFDFEANGTSLAIRVKATDEHNASREKTFTITITDDPSDNPIMPDTNATLPDANATLPDANATLPDANATLPDANATLPDANATLPDANATLPDANATLPDANATLPDANATLPDANATLPDANAGFIPEGNETSVAITQLPIVRTLVIEMDENQTLVFRGKILHDGNASLTKVGFLLQQSLASERQDDGAVRLEAVLVGDEFAITVEASTVGQSFYYWAFAENAIGLSLGTSKRFSLSASDSSHWWTGIPRSDGGWRVSGWFGSFLAFENGWLYHEHLGWLYSVRDGAGNLWLWSESHGWLWTGEDLFPHLYRNHDQTWIYFLKSKNGIPRFFNHATKQVE